MSDTLSLDLVVTRKPHRCWGCVETFAKGTKMWRHVGKSDGELFSTYTCEPCQAEMDEACRRDPYLADAGLEEGCVRDWRREAAEQAGKAGPA